MFNLTNRPITPHLTIYKPQLSSQLSIWHRISGVFLMINLMILIIIHKLLISLLIFQHITIIIISFKYCYTLTNIVILYHIFNGWRNILINFNYFNQLKYFKLSFILLFLLFNFYLTNQIVI